MSMRSRDHTQMPEDTGTLSRRLLAESNLYRILGDQLAGLLHDEQFAKLYQPTGRLALPPSLLALVTVFQFLEDLPDRQAAQQVGRAGGPGKRPAFRRRENQQKRNACASPHHHTSWPP